MSPHTGSGCPGIVLEEQKGRTVRKEKRCICRKKEKNCVFESPRFQLNCRDVYSPKISVEPHSKMTDIIQCNIDHTYERISGYNVITVEPSIFEIQNFYIWGHPTSKLSAPTSGVMEMGKIGNNKLKEKLKHPDLFHWSAYHIGSLRMG